MYLNHFKYSLLSVNVCYCSRGGCGARYTANIGATIIALNTAFGGTASGSAEFQRWAAALAALDVTAIAFAVGFAAGVEVSSSIKLLVFLHVVYNLTDHGHLKIRAGYSEIETAGGRIARTENLLALDCTTGGIHFCNQHLRRHNKYRSSQGWARAFRFLSGP